MNIRFLKKSAVATIALSVLAIGLGAVAPANATIVGNVNLSTLASPHGGWGAEAWANATNSNGQLAVLVKYHRQGQWWDQNSYAVEKFNADGTQDTSFGDSGWVDLPYDTGHDLQILSNNRILVAGGYYDWSRAEIRVARMDVLSNDGSVDTTFGTNGHVDLAGAGVGGNVYPDVHQVTALPNGKLAVALLYRDFNLSYQFVQVFQIRNADGSLDQSFGPNGNGETVLSAPEGSRELEVYSFSVTNRKFVINVGFKTAADGQQCFDWGWGEWAEHYCYPVPAPVVRSKIYLQQDGSLFIGRPASAPIVWGAKGGNHQASIGMWAPRNNGGTDIRGYEFTLDNGASWNPVDSSSTEFRQVIPGLTNGVGYTVRLRALNAAGAGEMSRPVMVRPLSTPGAPKQLTATAGAGSIKIEFSAPSSDTGLPVIRYAYSLDGGPWRSIGTKTSFVIKPLKNGTNYSVRVMAQNALGIGAPSEAVQATPQR